MCLYYGDDPWSCILRVCPMHRLVSIASESGLVRQLLMLLRMSVIYSTLRDVLFACLRLY